MTVRKKGEKWYCRFQIDGVRYERRCPLAVDERTALQAEKIIAAEIMRGNLGFAKATKTTTVKDALEILENHSKTNKLSYKADVSKINKFAEFFGENKPLSTINSTDFNKFKEFVKFKKCTEKIKIPNPDYKISSKKKYIFKEIETTKELSNATINRYTQTFSKMFNLCIKQGLIEINPCVEAGKLREENHKIRFLTGDEEKRLMAILENNYPYLFPIVLCAIKTGMRKSEILNLKWSQIDFNRGFIQILKSKSGKERKIPIAKSLDALLRRLFATSNSDFIFLNPKTQEPYVDITKPFKSALKTAEISNFRFHDLRHTVATRLVEKGTPLTVVQEILGHAEIKTTMRYAHPVPERKKSAIDLLDTF